MRDLSQATSALAFVSSEDRDLWIRMGMALKSEFGDAAFDSWDEWSQNSEVYKSNDARVAWRSFRRGGGTTIASLFFMAKGNGWKETNLPTLSTEQKRKAAALQRFARAQREIQDEKDEAAKLKSQKYAVERTKSLLANAEVLEHAYLKSKQLPEIKGFVTGDVLVIPLRNLHGEITGAQLIWYHDELVSTTEIHVVGMDPIVFRDLENEPDGFIKKFIVGTQAKGSVFRLGNRNAPTTILCEGYATGLSIADAAHLMRQDVSVLVCFSAFNTMYVSNLLKGYRHGIFADNDVAGKGEEYAKKAKVAYVMSDTKGEDANDIAVEGGIFVLAEKVRHLINSMK